MTRKKPSASAKKELRTTIKKLRSELDRADHKAKRLKSKVAQAEKTNTKLEARLKRLKKANKRPEKAPRAAEPPRAPVAHEPANAGPDDGWTVAALRAEARSRGLTGLSRKTKAELLDALR